MAALNKIGFVVKRRHSEAETLAVELARLALRKKRRVFFADDGKSFEGHFGPGTVKTVSKASLHQHVDLIVVLGGDGTFVSVARLMRKRSIPILGINMGLLGFLTEVKKMEAVDVFTRVLQGKKLKFSERTLLEVTLRRNGKIVFNGPVVNDAVIAKGSIARIIEVTVNVDGECANTIRADGVIVSTPTGSTAYSLAAGGPFIEPSVPALVVTPICPHSLTQRPIVLREDVVLDLRIEQKPDSVFLTLDGQDVESLKEGDIVTIRAFKKHKLKLISSPTRDYFTLLREKFRLGLGNSETS